MQLYVNNTLRRRCGSSLKINQSELDNKVTYLLL